MSSDFDPRKTGRFEAWRRNTLRSLHTYPLALQPVLGWLLASHTEVETSAAYVRSMNMENWWVTHNREVKHRMVILGTMLLAVALLWYLGVIQAIFFKGVREIWARKSIVMSVCNSAISKNVPMPRGTDLAAYTSAEWRTANPHPYGNLTERDYARGHALLSAGWLGGEIVALHLKEIEDTLKLRSEHKRCACAAHFGVPLASFAFNGRMYWQTYDWLVTPSGQNKTCIGFPSIYTQEHAKLLVRTALCEPKKKAIGLQFSKAELCCMEYCKGVA